MTVSLLLLVSKSPENSESCTPEYRILKRCLTHIASLRTLMSIVERYYSSRH